MKEVKVISVNISEKKGTIKKPVKEIDLNNCGVSNDAHAGDWHRQVSMLGLESFSRFEKQANRKINYGEFAENITTEGLELFNTKPFDRFISDKVVLEVTQIGKKCHGNTCAIFKEVGDCVMPKEGIFCRVIRAGTVKPGDTLQYHPRIFKILIITLSDRASRGEYSDRSGPEINSLTETFFKETGWQYQIENTVIPDDEEKLKTLLLKAAEEKADIIFTTGGTGIGPKDITPEVVKPMLDKEIPGIMEMIRMKYGSEKPNALLSRGIAGIMGNTFVYTLPGSVKAVREHCAEIFKTQQHLFYMLYALDVH